MYTVTLCNCAVKPAQAREAERLYCQAMDDHFGSAQATLAAFHAAKDDDFSNAAWLQADYAAGCTALAGVAKYSGGANFKVTTK